MLPGHWGQTFFATQTFVHHELFFFLGAPPKPLTLDAAAAKFASRRAIDRFSLKRADAKVRQQSPDMGTAHVGWPTLSFPNTFVAFVSGRFALLCVCVYATNAYSDAF